MDYIIRNIDLDTDIKNVREAHGADEHWGSDEACYASGKTSLENGFHIQVAVCGDKIIGHVEWVVSDEPNARFLYLGMMQVHDDFQKRGIGSKLIECGAAYAKQNGCAFLRTCPSIESGSVFFYQKNGFAQIKDSNRYVIIKTKSAVANSAVKINTVPFAVIKEKTLLSGFYQHASAHIWKVFNARHEYDERIVSTYKIGGAYVNIGAFKPNKEAHAVLWGEKITTALIAEILSLGGGLGYDSMEFCILEENLKCFTDFDCEVGEKYDVFMERRL